MEAAEDEGRRAKRGLLGVVTGWGWGGGGSKTGSGSSRFSCCWRGGAGGGGDFGASSFGAAVISSVSSVGPDDDRKEPIALINKASQFSPQNSWFPRTVQIYKWKYDFFFGPTFDRRGGAGQEPWPGSPPLLPPLGRRLEEVGGRGGRRGVGRAVGLSLEQNKMCNCKSDKY